MGRPAAAPRRMTVLVLGLALGGLALAAVLAMRGGWVLLIALLQPDFWR